MRKSIRPFVVETVKSRHDRSTLERNSFGALLAEAEPKFADHPAFKTASPEPAPAGALDRPAPKRVLDAVVPVEAPAPEPVERKRGRPRLQRPAPEMRGETAAALASAEQPVAATRSSEPAPSFVPAVAATRPAVSSASEASGPASRREGRSKSAPSLKPGQRWMAQLPKSTQKRLLSRSRGARG
jgi:hypothetical protein